MQHPIAQTAAAYDIDMVNGVDFLVRTAKLQPGDKIGHVYFEGEYGENALAGATYAARQHKLSIVEQKIKPTDQDLTAQVTALKQAGVKATRYAGRDGGAVLSRTVRRVETMSVPERGTSCSRIWRRTSWTLRRPTSAKSWCTVVRGGMK